MPYLDGMGIGHWEFFNKHRPVPQKSTTPHPCPLPLPVAVFSLQDAWKAEFRQDGPANAGADKTEKKTA